MKLIITCLSILLSSILIAQQKQSFISSGKQFTVHWDNSNPNFSNLCYYWFDGDTTISSKMYQILWFENIPDPYDVGPIRAAFLREDTMTRKIFRYPRTSNEGNTEQLLYDFNLNVNDSLYVMGNWYQWGYKKITMIDSATLLDGRIIKRWHTNTSDYFNNYILFSEYVPFGQIQPHYSDGLDGELECAFADSSVKIYGGPMCNYNYISVEETILNTSGLVYPNPAESVLIVKGEFNEGVIELYNLNGKTILKEKTDQTKKVFDIHHLPSGLYIWRITGNSKWATGKLIIQ